MSAKRKYFISSEVTISLHTEVEASSIEEAIEIATDRDLPAISWPGKDDDAAEMWCDSGEIDGTPKNLRAEAVPRE